MTTTSRRIADGLFVLVAHHMDLGETWVVPEDEFIQMMKLNSDYFNPMVSRNCSTIGGEEFNGYVWFNKHVNRLSRDNDHVVDYFRTISECFSAYDFGRMLTIPNHEGYDREDLDGPILHSMVKAGNLDSWLLNEVHIAGLTDNYPWRAGPGSEDKTSQDVDTDPNVETDQKTRPMWLL